MSAMSQSPSLTVAVTGATGFLGRHTVATLLDAGHAVVCLSRRGTVPVDPATGQPHEAALESGRVKGLSCDVLDLDALTAATTGADVLVHGAGMVSNRSRDARKVFDLHVTGTEHAVAACRTNGIARMVHISTSGTIAVGTDPDKVFTETDDWAVQTTARWPYYRTKLFSEQAALDASGDGLTVVSLNPSLLLGPGDDPEGESTASVRTFLEDGLPASPPGGVAFVDVRDVARAVLAALTKGRGGERYLLNGANQSFHDYFCKLARIADKPAPLVRLPQAARSLVGFLKPGSVLRTGFGPSLSKQQLDLSSHFWYCDASKAAEELGFVARDPTETLADTVHDLERHAVW